MNSCIYLTRNCPYHCSYCRLRNSPLAGPDLSAERWIEAQHILFDMGVNFNLFLGNETWLYDALPNIVNARPIPYACYTSCKPALFKLHAVRWFQPAKSQWGVDNLSCGCDFPLDMCMNAMDPESMDDEIRKAYNAHTAFITTRKLFPHVDCQGTITISRRNIPYVPQIIRELSMIGVDVGLNFIHSNTDGCFDFFPYAKEMEDYLLVGRRDEQKLLDLLDQLKRMTIHRVQNMADTIDLLENHTLNIGRLNTCWHCDGDPYGGPSIDADGSLRCCGYRKGIHTPQMSIFDLTTAAKIQEWKNRVSNDCQDCPGCTWSYPRLWARYRDNPEQGKQVFTNHAQFAEDGKLIRRNERDVQ